MLIYLDRLHFEERNVSTLTDGPNQPLPRDVIFEKLRWLFGDVLPGDVLVLFSKLYYFIHRLGSTHECRIVSGHCVMNEGNKVVSFLTVEGKSRHAFMPSTVRSASLTKS